MLFYSFKGISQQQQKILHVTLICVKLHLRGGPPFDSGRRESFLTLNRVMLIQWGMCCSCFRVNKVKYSGVKLIHPAANGKMSAMYDYWTT